MIYTEMTKKALKLSFEAHKNQLDKSGTPYVYHPFHVAEQMKTEDETIVALLHDVVEDTDYTLENMRKMGFPEEVINALTLMTHDKTVPYMDYVEAIKNNPIAKTVKLADLRHNSDLTRLDTVDAKAISRVQQYAKAIKLLSEENVKFLNISLFCVRDGQTCLSGEIYDGCLYILSEVWGGDMDSEKHYDFSEEETVKLFSIISVDKFVHLCEANNLTKIESFLERNKIKYSACVI